MAEIKINLENFDNTSLTVGDEILAIINQGKSAKVVITEWAKDRSIPANNTQWRWYGQIGKFTSTDTKTVAAECKIDFGLPILLADKEVGHVLSYALRGFERMTREQQVKFISVIQVTSIMSSKQHTQYRDSIVNYYQMQGLDINYR